MTLQYQPRFGGGTPGRRYEEIRKDAGTRMRNATIGGAVGGVAGYQGTGLLTARALQTELPKYGGPKMSFGDVAKPVMRNWNNPRSMKNLLTKAPELKKPIGILAGGAAAIGAGAGALRGGKKPPQIAPTYNNYASPMAKADWRNISEHQTQAAQGRRRTKHGALVASAGAGAMGAMGTQGLREMGAIADGHRQVHQHVNNFNAAARALGANRHAGLGERAKAHLKFHRNSMKVAPAGHISGLGAGALAVGSGMAISGAMKRKKHDRAITQLRRQRASSSVGKSREFDPEARRQRSLGAAEAVSGLAGAGGLAVGGRGIARSTRDFRRMTGYEGITLSHPPNASPKVKAAHEARMRATLKKKPIVGSKKHFLLAAGGAAGLGAAGAIHNHATSARGRAWY